MARKGKAKTRSAAGTVRKQRAIQSRVDRRDQQDETESGRKKRKAVQAGTRSHPVNFLVQHLAKPGNEHELEEQPHYLAPDYRGSDKLVERVALITGDVKDPEFCVRAVDRTVEEFGHLDILVNNAGFQMRRTVQLEELSPAYVFLAAPVCSSYINGSVLEVIGGPEG